MKKIVLTLSAVFALSFIYPTKNLFAQLSLQDSLIAHYTLDGNAQDVSGNNNHGTPVGATLTADRFGNPNTAYSFNGISDYIDLSPNAKFKPNLPVTISAWINLADYTTNLIFQNDFEENFYTGVWMNTVSGSLTAAFGDGAIIDPSNRRSKRGTTVMDLNKWYHVAVVIRGATDMDLYVNGVNDCGVYSGTGGNLQYSIHNGTIGKTDAAGQPGPLLFFNGKMDDIRFYSRELSPVEILSLQDTLPGPAFTDTTICRGDTVVLDGGAGPFYSWSPMSGLVCDSICANPKASPDSTTTYTVSNFNSAGCTTTYDILVQVEDCNCGNLNIGPDFSYSIQDNVVEFINQSADTFVYITTWDFGDGQDTVILYTDTISHTFTTTSSVDSFHVCLTAGRLFFKDRLCEDSICKWIVISYADAISQPFSALGWELYPNPASNQISLQFNTSIRRYAEITVIDHLGRRVIVPIRKERDRLILDTSLLPQGIYVIKVQADEEEGSGRFIKIFN